eukprot:scaffold441_cov382-Prasinococcus_capsulatus_cf.AAC.11
MPKSPLKAAAAEFGVARTTLGPSGSSKLFGPSAQPSEKASSNTVLITICTGGGSGGGGGNGDGGGGEGGLGG